MKILGFRHSGIPVEGYASMKIMENFLIKRCGFVEAERGLDVINGARMDWVKVVSSEGDLIEIITGGSFHIAFTVNHVDPNHYYYVTPSGHKIQYGWIENLLIEYVEEP